MARFFVRIESGIGQFSRSATQEDAGVAQLVEHLICNQTVGGSNPSASSIKSITYSQLRASEGCFGSKTVAKPSSAGFLVIAGLRTASILSAASFLRAGRTCE